MKTIEALERAINEAFKDVVEPEKVQALGKIKNELEHVKEEAKKQDEIVEQSVTKVRDLLLNGGSFGKKDESLDGEPKEKSLEDCFKEVTKGDK